MKKLQVIFLFVFLMGCSSGPSVVLSATPAIVSTPTLIPTPITVPSTQTLTPTATFMPNVTSTAISNVGGKIAFTSERDGYPEIYVINSDGSNLTKLTNDIIPKYGPSWSPDRKKIAFGTNDEDAASLYSMNADGSNPTKLIDIQNLSPYNHAPPDWRFATGCCNPVWSPDGTKIGFSILHYVGCCLLYGSLYVINADGSNLLSVSEYPSRAFGLVWSPDGKKIAFGGDCRGAGICVMDSDGTNLVSLGQKSGLPSWAPDGQKMVFAEGWGREAKVYVMNADGTNLVNLTDYASPWDHGPVWSPDGKKIAFSSYRDGHYEIYLMNADGTKLFNLTKNLAADRPVWSPDSSKIAFISGREGNSEIYVINADGSDPLNLTNNDAEDYSPVWSP